MVKQAYIPECGDLVWIDFQPQKGREITKRRPAIILSSKKYNRTTGLCVLCPISSKIKGHLFEVSLAVAGRQCVVKSDQVKSLDWRARNIENISTASVEVIEDVRQILKTLLLEP